MKVTHDAAQIFGGYGLAEEYPVGRWFQEAKVLEVGEGANELHRQLIADYALGYRRM
jgi:alkylation response protein AidB-like acyl-CoA dehydrogenase